MSFFAGDRIVGCFKLFFIHFFLGKPGPSSLAQQAPQYPPGPFGRAYPHPTEGAAPYPPVQT